MTAVIELYDVKSDRSITGFPISDKMATKQSLTESSDPKWTSNKLNFSQKYEYFELSELPNVGQIIILEIKCNILNLSESSIDLKG